VVLDSRSASEKHNSVRTFFCTFFTGLVQGWIILESGCPAWALRYGANGKSKKIIVKCEPYPGVIRHYGEADREEQQ
jgi:hypothetical protein